MADAESVLTKLLHTIAVERGIKDFTVEVVPISSGGANYTSQLYTATIKNGEHLYLFAKVAAMGEKIRSQAPMRLYDTESLAYKKLFPEYRQIEKVLNIPEEHKLRVPEFFGSDETWLMETVVLEDLSKKGFMSHDRFKSIDWPYAKAAVTQMARLHALSLAFYQKHPEEAAKISKELKFKFDIHDVSMKNYWDKVFEKALGVTKDENKERLRSYFVDSGDNMDTFKAYYTGLRCTAVIHSDYRPSNLMHKQLEDGSFQVIPVDFQTLRPGSPAIDLLYFIFSGSDEKFRAKHFDDLIQYYYSKLCGALRLLKMDPEDVYSKEDFEFEWRKKLPFGLSVSMFLLPLITVEVEDAPKVDKDMDFSIFSVEKTGNLYPDRMNGVVNDFIKWGIL